MALLVLSQMALLQVEVVGLFQGGNNHLVSFCQNIQEYTYLSIE